MNDDDSFRLLDDKDVFYVCMLLFMFTLVFGGCSQTSTEEALRNPPAFQRPLPCDAIVAQRGAGEPFVSRCYYFSDKGKR